MHAYEVGFWATLEVILYRAICAEDHWEVIQAYHDDRNARIAEACAEERAEMH